MITLDQIRSLDLKVTKAVERIRTLQQENTALKKTLSSYEKKVGDLEVLIEDFKQGQEEIEKGILTALSQLDRLEDELGGEGSSIQSNDSPPVQAKQAEKPDVTSPPEEQDEGEGNNSEQPQTGELDIF
jgi:chromosome segregation ATPase